MKERRAKAKDEYVSRHAAPERERDWDYDEDISADDFYSYHDGYDRQDDYDSFAEDTYDGFHSEGSPSRQPSRTQLRQHRRRRRLRKLKISLAVITAVLLIIAGAATVGGYYVTHLPTSFPNVYVDGVLLGDMSREQMLAALDASGWDENSALALNVSLLDKTSFDVDQCSAGVRLTKEQAADAAEIFGHAGNWYLNLVEYARCLLRPVDINRQHLSYNREYVLTQVDIGISNLNGLLGDGAYEVDEEASVLRMTKGAGQLEFDREAVADAIFAALEADKTELRWDSIAKEPVAPDFQAIFEKLSAAPADAYFTEDNSFTVVDHVVGCDFDVADAIELWKNCPIADEVVIPLDITYPEITGDYLRSLLFRDKLGAMTTGYPNSNDNRISNVNKAANTINGIILYPGEVFSYNETLGQRTEENGFLPAGAYENGEVVEEVGGGICQVSSTLYSAMLYGYRLTTVERTPHYFPVDYLQKGYDATVSWPNPDFKFRNDRDFPIKIVAACDNEARLLTVEIWGTNLDGYYIELRTTTFSYMNSEYPWLHEGYGVQMFRRIMDANGMQVDEQAEIYDVYHTHEFAEQKKALDAQKAAYAAAGMEMPVYY